jgi:hypothetical protein
MLKITEILSHTNLYTFNSPSHILDIDAITYFPLHHIIFNILIYSYFSILIFNILIFNFHMELKVFHASS